MNQLDRKASFLIGCQVVPEAVMGDSYPFHLRTIRELDLAFTRAVTFFVGENGTGKSTVIEALAEHCGYPASGGSRNERDATHGPDRQAALARGMRASFLRHPRDGFFFRAEFQAHFASLLDERRDDPDFLGNPYGRYGGRSLHTRSHGEAFLALFQERIGDGLYLFDEPESALSPQRQLVLLAQMAELVSAGGSQFLIATHSPILLTFPGAEILSFDGDEVRPVRLEDTPHYQITKGILDCPARYWKTPRGGSLRRACSVGWVQPRPRRRPTARLTSTAMGLRGAAANYKLPLREMRQLSLLAELVRATLRFAGRTIKAGLARTSLRGAAQRSSRGRRGPLTESPGATADANSRVSERPADTSSCGGT